MPNRLLPIVFLTLLLDMIGTGMVFPIIPIIFTDPASSSFLLHGYSREMQFFIAGLITALFGLMQFLAAPILGELSDYYGRKRLLMVGVAVLAISQMFFGLGIMIASIPLLLFSRAIAGIAGANFSIAQAAIADVSKPEDRAKNFGLMGAAFGIGFILGPIIGGWTATLAHNAAAPFWLAGALGIMNLLIVYFFMPETRPTSAVRRALTWLRGIHNIRQALSNQKIRLFYATSFLYMCGFAFFTSFASILLVNRFAFSAGQVGTFFGVVGICMVLTQVFVVRYAVRYYSERQILRVSLPCVAFSIFCYAVAPSVFALYLLVPFLSVSVGLTMANMTALISKSAGADTQGLTLGISGSLNALAQGLVPLLAGIGSGLLSLSMPFVVGAVLVSIAWYILAYRLPAAQAH